MFSSSATNLYHNISRPSESAVHAAPMVDSAWETDWDMSTKRFKQHSVKTSHTLSPWSSSKWLIGWSVRAFNIEKGSLIVLWLHMETNSSNLTRFPLSSFQNKIQNTLVICQILWKMLPPPVEIKEGEARTHNTTNVMFGLHCSWFRCFARLLFTHTRLRGLSSLWLVWNPDRRGLRYQQMAFCVFGVWNQSSPQSARLLWVWTGV